MGFDAYNILGVTPKANQSEIRNAYRKLAKKLHPDLNPGNKDAEKKFKEVNVAYEMLGEPEKRAKYDRGEFSEIPHQGPWTDNFRTRPNGGGGGARKFSFGPEGAFDDDIMNSIFEQMRGRGDGFSVKGEDELYQMEIDFKDAVLGAQKEITLPSGKKLAVKIPAGVETGTKLRIAGLGGPGRGSAPSGDAYVQLNVRPSNLFRRQGHDVEMELPISVSEAVFGAEIKVPTVDGAILLKIPAGASSGQKLRVPGKGVPWLKFKKRGNQIVVLKIVLPRKVDEQFKAALAAWDRREKFNPREV